MADLEEDIIAAKSYLLSRTNTDGVILYDHAASVLKEILSTRPDNAGDIFEQVSAATKASKYTSDLSTLLDQEEPSTEFLLAELQKKLFEKNHDVDENDITEEENPALPNLMEEAAFFEAAGIGLNREEIFRLSLAIKVLANTFPMQKVRFWGKIFGQSQNYNIVEAKFEEGYGEFEEDEEEEIKEEEEQKVDIGGEDAEEGGFESGAPQPKWVLPPVIPPEPFGSGVNKFAYFVCTEPGRPWVRLPMCTPAQLQCARRIRKFFTGNLDARIITHPPFPGLEKHYLRAQIARISASTHVSPLGLYHFDEEEALDEDDMGDNFVLNEDFEGLSLAELIDPGMENWVHHSKYILPQGRCTWWNPKTGTDEEEEETGEEEGPEPETGMPSLAPLAEDRTIHGKAAWTARISSKQIPQFSFAYISSNLWPGAHAFSAGAKFSNIYVGNGHKFLPSNFNPVPPPAVMTEYEWGLEILETDDPTPEEEAALKAMLQAKVPTEEMGEEEEEEREEDEEDDDDD